MPGDSEFMLRALTLAKLGLGRVEPNPMVGAVVVREETIVGEGFHQAFGGPHAEIHALAQAGEQALGATLYVTLEPCSHFGKTPPCVDAIIQSGIKKVVAAILDPFPAVSGSGIERLRSAGIEVIVGVEESAAKKLNSAYFKLIKTCLPYVTAKWAMTLDGKIATKSRDSRWISSEASRAKAHELRGRVDAIVVGIGTVLADDPQLTARPQGLRTATRVVFDRQLRLPVDSKLVRSTQEAPVLVLHQCADAERQRKLQDRGCELLLLQDCSSTGMVQHFLEEAGRRRWCNIMVEGGGHLLGSFFDAKAIDEAWVFLASKIIGGVLSPSPVRGEGVQLLQECMQFEFEETTPLQGDFFLRAVRCRND